MYAERYHKMQVKPKRDTSRNQVKQKRKKGLLHIKKSTPLGAFEVMRHPINLEAPRDTVAQQCQLGSLVP
jgi:hypothetical protein